MTLNGTQSKVLLEIGLSPGGNAFSIAKKLKRDSGGINKVCAALHQKGLISVTEGKNIKNAPVNELKLTLLGFALVVNGLYAPYTRYDDPVSSDYNSNITSLLNGARDLHEGVDIFADFFSFAIENYSDAPRSTDPPGTRRTPRNNYGHHVSRQLSSTLKISVDLYKYMVQEHPPGLVPAEVERVAHDALYRDLFFEMWMYAELREAFSFEDEEPDRECEYFKNMVLPRFKASKGLETIIEELESRESECERLKQIRTSICE